MKKKTFNQQVEDMIEALGDFEDGSTCELLVEGKQDRIKRDSYTYVNDITKENEQVLVETQNKKETSYYYGIDLSGKTEEQLNKVKEEQYLYNGSSDVVQLVQESSIRYYEYDDSGRSSLIEGSCGWNGWIFKWLYFLGYISLRMATRYCDWINANHWRHIFNSYSIYWCFIFRGQVIIGEGMRVF